MFWVWYTLAITVPVAAWALYKFQPWVRQPFINKTKGVLTDADLRSIFAAAAKDLATNPFPPRPVLGDSSMHQCDSAALDVHVRAVTVVVHDDTASGDGWFDSGHTYPVRGLTRVNKWTPFRITISRRWAREVLIYEFQNLILYLLGYDVSGR